MVPEPLWADKATQLLALPRPYHTVKVRVSTRAVLREPVRPSASASASTSYPTEAWVGKNAGGQRDAQLGVAE